MNEDLLSSTLHVLQEMSSTSYKIKVDALITHQTQLKRIKEKTVKLKSQPNRKELEREFAALEGSVLTDIDNLKRKLKKLKLSSPEVNDIQCAVESLEVGVESILLVWSF